MDNFVWNHENKHKYFYKKRVVSKTGKEYWRYYPPRWGEGPVISRVKLNPEQAVLTCCDFSILAKTQAGLSACHLTNPCAGSKSALST